MLRLVNRGNRRRLETDTHALLMIQHVAMLPAMLLAMLLRRHEYTGHH